jgi:hypothetical protein
MMDADQLVKRQFQKSCNLYMPNSVYTSLGRPQGVKLYEGDFMGHEVDNKDELVAINLAATVADVVLLIGFNLSERQADSDKLQEHKAKNYYGLIKQAIKSNEQTQWIVVDHTEPLSKEFSDLPNLDKDTFDNVLTILNA